MSGPLNKVCQNIIRVNQRLVIPNFEAQNIIHCKANAAGLEMETECEDLCWLQRHYFNLKLDVNQ